MAQCRNCKTQVGCGCDLQDGLCRACKKKQDDEAKLKQTNNVPNQPNIKH